MLGKWSGTLRMDMGLSEREAPAEFDATSERTEALSLGG